jgi:hypothetical protein
MRRNLLSLLILIIIVLGLIVVYRWFPDTVRDGVHTITPYTSPFAFSLVILVIALFTWFMRTLVESDPDPFFLNLTFFAFAGQCIRTGEFFGDGNRSIFLLILFLIALLAVGFQVFVLKAHMHTTLKHYKELLTKYRKDGCSDHDIEHWASVLLHITGTDFSPGIYRWLKWLPEVFPSEPRAKSRMDAFSILPETDFQKAPSDETGLTAGLMAVPSEKREALWRLYWVTCVVSWGIFVVAILISQEVKS